MKHWGDFWKTKNILSKKVVNKNMDIFLESSHITEVFDKRSIVLDLGSGYGDLANRLSDLVDVVYCADLSPIFLQYCKEIFKDKPNVIVHQLEEDYTDLSALYGNGINVVVCMSVLQYYNSIEEVEKLLVNCKSLSSSVKVIFADVIPSKEHKIIGAIKSLFSSIKQGYFFSEFKFLLSAAFSEYNKIYKENGLLLIDKITMRKLLRANGAKNIKFIDSPTTINKSRYTVTFEYS